MNRIGSKQTGYGHSQIKSLRNSQTITPAQSYTSSPMEWHVTSSRANSVADKFFETFQYKDEVTLKKTHMKNLCKPSNPASQKKKQQINAKNWTNEKYYEEKKQKLRELQHFMEYIRSMKKIKTNRNNQLTSCDNSRCKKRVGVMIKSIKDLNLVNRSSEQSDAEKNIKIRCSIGQNIAKQKRMMNKMKQEVYQISLDKFRKYFRNQQNYDPKYESIFKLPEFIKRKAKQGKKFESKYKREVDFNEKQLKRLRDIEYQREFQNFQKETVHALNMRIRHQTQFNWQNAKKA